MSDLEKYGKGLDISHSKLFLKSKIDTPKGKIIVNTIALTTKYLDVLKKSCILTTLSDSDYLYYKWQPKLYCYNVFGTTELWSLLLRVNNLISASEFTLQTFLTFSSKTIPIINEMLILEESNILNNQYEIENN